MDQDAFIIYHPAMLEKDLAEQQTLVLPDLDNEFATYLLREGYIETTKCHDFAWRKTYQTYKVNIRQRVYHGQDRSVFIEPINGTNTFLIIKTNSDDKLKSPANFCLVNNNTAQACSSVDGRVCPCFNNIQFDNCENSFPENMHEDVSGCSRGVYDEAQIHSTVNQSELSAATPCFDYSCDVLSVSWRCGLTAACAWCADQCTAEADCVTKSGKYYLFCTELINYISEDLSLCLYEP